MGEWVFTRCEALKTINFGGTILQWAAVTGKDDADLPDSITVNYNK